MRGLDFAAGRPGAKAIKAAGFDFVVRYLTDGGTELPGKLLLPAEMDDYIAHEVGVCFMYETTANRALSGYDGGFSDANSADHYLLSMGLASQVVYFAVDFDSTPEQQAVLNQYLRGAGSYLGNWRVGGYGGFWPISRAFDAGVISWGEQTTAWSGDNRDTRCHLFQTGEQVVINGITCDVVDSLALDFGQYPPPFGERSHVDFSTQWVDHYHDDKPDHGLTQEIGDLISWASAHSAHAVEEVRKLRADLPTIIQAAIASATIHVTVENKAP